MEGVEPLVEQLRVLRPELGEVVAHLCVHAYAYSCMHVSMHIYVRSGVGLQGYTHKLAPDRAYIHARTVRRLQVSGTGWIPPSPFVQFKLYQGEVFQYKPGTRDWVESTQSETPESALRSERGYCNAAIYTHAQGFKSFARQAVHKGCGPDAHGWMETRG